MKYALMILALGTQLAIANPLDNRSNVGDVIRIQNDFRGSILWINGKSFIGLRRTSRTVGRDDIVIIRRAGVSAISVIDVSSLTGTHRVQVCEANSA